MLEGKQLILATRPYAKEKRSTSWKATISTLLLIGLAYTVALSPIPLLLRIPAALVTSLLLVRFFIIYHDYLHHTILQKSKLADAIFTVFGWYILAPKSIWKRSHDHHHKHNSKLFTSGIGSFPIVTLRKFRALSRLEKINYLFIRHPLTIGFGYVFAFLWGMCILSLTRSPGKHWDSAVALLFHFGIGALVFATGGLTSFLVGFLLPSFVAGTMGSYLFYAQHNFPTVEFYNKEDWAYADAALNSSSYMKMSKLMHWFTGNIGNHHIHHANARIPFYRLLEVYAAFPEFQQARTTSLLPHDVWQCLSLKVWDPDANRMLTRKEIRS